MSYTATNIQILDNPAEEFTWLKAEELAKKYKKNVEWVRRGLMACEQVGIPSQFFIDKYLEDKDLPKNEEMIAVYKHLVKNGY